MTPKEQFEATIDSKIKDDKVDDSDEWEEPEPIICEKCGKEILSEDDYGLDHNDRLVICSDCYRAEVSCAQK